MSRVFWHGALCLLVTGLASCAKVSSGPGQEGLAGRPIRVVATTTVIADLVRAVGGERVVVEGLMGPGVDPHLFKASARDVTRMAEADIIIYNGLHLEGKMTDVFAEMRERGTPTLAVAEGIHTDLLRESALFQGNYDPHIWLDARLWQRAAAVVTAELVAMDSASAGTFQARRDAYTAKLDTVDAYVRAAAEHVAPAQRVIVTSHDAFGYYGAAYGFEVEGLQGISTATEAGTADVQRVATLVAARRIPAIFVESSISPRGIEAVREAVRARGFDVVIGGTLFGDALDAPGTACGTYLGMLRYNTDTIVEALSYAGSDRGT